MENNQTKTREALDRIGNIAGFVSENCGDQQTAKYMNDIISEVQSSLSAPPRNCDVGTAEEQTKRMRNNCNKYKPSCIGCKYVTDLQKENCWLAWAQMPYEAKEVEK